jgi:hypothetical protein
MRSRPSLNMMKMELHRLSDICGDGDTRETTSRPLGPARAFRDPDRD